jgi:DNA-directed RNA polymerase subunit alpha
MSDFGFYDEDGVISLGETDSGSPFVTYRPRLDEEVLVEGSRSRFTIDPLEPGFGYTIGNSLRRTLLSSVPGAAVTRIRFTSAQAAGPEGGSVLHEFSAIEGVKEDVTDIILNIKDLVVRSDSDEQIEIFLGGDGPGVLTAENIFAPSQVEVVNEDLHIATLNANGHLEMYLTVERGRGYLTADENKRSGDPIGVIAVDSVFSPVRRVSYRVESTRVEQMTNYDKLIVDVETDGSVSPAQALSSAGETLKACSSSSPSTTPPAPAASSSRPRRRWPGSAARTRSSRCRSRTSTCRCAPTTASSARAWPPSASCGTRPSRTCSRSATSARSRSTRSRTSSPSSGSRSRSRRPPPGRLPAPRAPQPRARGDRHDVRHGRFQRCRPPSEAPGSVPARHTRS